MAASAIGFDVMSQKEVMDEQQICKLTTEGDGSDAQFLQISIRLQGISVNAGRRRISTSKKTAAVHRETQVCPAGNLHTTSKLREIMTTGGFD